MAVVLALADGDELARAALVEQLLGQLLVLLLQMLSVGVALDRGVVAGRAGVLVGLRVLKFVSSEAVVVVCRVLAAFLLAYEALFVVLVLHEVNVQARLTRKALVANLAANFLHIAVFNRFALHSGIFVDLSVIFKLL